MAEESMKKIRHIRMTTRTRTLLVIQPDGRKSEPQPDDTGEVCSVCGQLVRRSVEAQVLQALSPGDPEEGPASPVDAMTEDQEK
jgi:hypothetical protein